METRDARVSKTRNARIDAVSLRRRYFNDTEADVDCKGETLQQYSCFKQHGRAGLKNTLVRKKEKAARENASRLKTRVGHVHTN